ncbi:hypothetical protein GCM10011416_09420 [Polaribacter pacificus]|uniref:Histidine kinase domain-containing protein n=1 Tax=Polaribacter pacificus TaxID=1775173 RepID=A0A917HYE4_9FLAO|nr:sensor histidine kinase [Polaribacter pacificus]GGG94229.1 hypothetical protein GCM10011416_09420 [Polaribacter pacificus]
MKFTLRLFLLFFYSYTTAQVVLPKISELPETKIKIEKFIIESQLDSASYYLRQLEEDDYDKEIYTELIEGNQISYKDFYSFVSRLGNRRSLYYDKVSDFINRFLIPPTDTKKINLDYVEIKWTQITKLRDDVSLEKASKEQEKALQYVSKFDPSDKDVQRTLIKMNTHPIVMYLIQKDIKKGKELTLQSLETARQLGDIQLEIGFLYHLSDFLLLERNLDEYIKISEESLLLEEKLPRVSSYYHSTVEHLIDAYIFKGGHNERVVSLIHILNDDFETTMYTSILYAKLITKLEKNSPLKNEILQKFEAKDIPTLVGKLDILGKNLNSNDLFRLYTECSNVLEVYGFYPQAIAYKDKAIELNRKIYSEELSNSLANFKTEQAVAVKEKEIDFEKEKTKLYGVIAGLAGLFLLISLYVIIKMRKQSKELSEKNRIIKKALKEKEFLIKEVHHRVKNNFQVVSSLLELQSKGIEDKKALELANEGKNRVKSMALIHQKLYQNNTGLVDFDEYIRLLVKELSSLNTDGKEVQTNIESKHMFFDVDTAIPLGLIINEIITNSYKYAFSKDRSNTLDISIQKDGDDDYTLTVSDNGPGIDSAVETRKSKSLGLRLISRLVKQLQGTLEQTNSGGAKFTIHFKDIRIRHAVD